MPYGWTTIAARSAFRTDDSKLDSFLTSFPETTTAEVMERLEVLILMAAELPIVSIHRQAASALDLVVHIDRMADGSRKVTQISELTGVDPDTNRVNVTDIFNVRGELGLYPTGYLPSFVDSLVSKELLDLEFLYGAGSELMDRNGTPPAARSTARQN